MGRLLNAIPNTLGEEAGQLGYFTKAEARELTAPQIPAQSASDRSNVTIKVGPVLGSWAGSSLALTE